MQRGDLLKFFGTEKSDSSESDIYVEFKNHEVEMAEKLAKKGVLEKIKEETLLKTPLKTPLKTLLKAPLKISVLKN